jgi:exopolysaccharide biosynthesis polyprenyl glycosylphosphotransferase
MFRTHPLIGPSIVAAGDLSAIAGAFALLPFLSAESFTPWLLLPIALAHQIAVSGRGLHGQLRYISMRDLLRRIFWAWLRIATFVCLVGFLAPDWMPRRAALAYCGAFFAMLLAVRLWSLLAKRWVRERGTDLRYFVVAGNGPSAVRAAQIFTENAGFGLRLVGFLGKDSQPNLGAPVLGNYSDIVELVRTHVVDEVIVADPEASMSEVTQIVETCRMLGLRTFVIANFLPGAWRGVDAIQLHGEVVVSLTPFPHDVFGLTIKRMMDGMLAAVAMAALLPLFLLIALAIKLDSRGPVFFVQWRIGLNGRRFRFPKFRSMRADAEARLGGLMADNEMDGPVFKIRHDPRITRVGRFLRRYSCDELPQLWNVFIGNMSLVGPRPLMPHEIAGHQAWQRRRLSMRPGLTCLWQVSGRNQIDFDHWMRLDLEYIDRWSLGLDLRILARTVPAVISGRGAS